YSEDSSPGNMRKASRAKEEYWSSSGAARSKTARDKIRLHESYRGPREGSSSLNGPRRALPTPGDKLDVHSYFSLAQKGSGWPEAEDDKLDSLTTELPFGSRVVKKKPSNITDLDVETMKRADAFHNATEEEKGPWNDGAADESFSEAHHISDSDNSG
ncbi:MAG: hypothetical protein M4579_007638, partial [Chaenotheca gracillima]